MFGLRWTQLQQLSSVDERDFLRLRDKYIESQFSNLNNEQRQAALHVQGPEIVLSGAGTGKTTVIVNRIQNILKFGTAYKNSEYDRELVDESVVDELKQWEKTGVDLSKKAVNALRFEVPSPWNILAVTFTNKAAREMKDRIGNVVGDTLAKDIQASTFHSLCAKILRIESKHTGFSNHFTIYDSDDSKRLMKDIIKQQYGQDDEDNKGRNGRDASEIDAATALSYTAAFKDNLISVDEVEEQLIEYDEQSYDYIYRSLYKPYQQALREANAMDFDDLIYNTVRLFGNELAVLRKYQDKYRYIMVDEYQDTSKAQSELIDMLASGWFNLCVVGDEDQSIYSFRGAIVKNILGFGDKYPGTYKVKLEENYRSTKNILDAANSVIKNNKIRTDKKLWTHSDSGVPVETCDCTYSCIDEADWVAEKIIDNKLKYKNTAILYRLNSQSGPLERKFIQSGIPYRIIGGTRFFDRKEVKDILAYMTILVNPADSIRLKRIINVPARKIGLKTVDKLEMQAKLCNMDIVTMCKHAWKFDDLKRQSKQLGKFYELYDELVKQTNGLSLSDTVQTIYDITDYKNALAGKDDSFDRKMNINQLESMADEFEKRKIGLGEPCGIQEFLEEVSLLSDIDNYDKTKDAVTMMTMHSSKGLEFENVFLVGWSDGIFPSSRALQADDAETAIEEERRLAYVGMTRAKKRLFISWQSESFLWGQYKRYKPQRFLYEINPDVTSGDLKIIMGNTEKSVGMTVEHRSDRDFRGNALPKPGDTVAKGQSLGTVESITEAGRCHVITVRNSIGERYEVIWEYAMMRIIDG